MPPFNLKHCHSVFMQALLFSAASAVSSTPCAAQAVEIVGSRALGMGGAFVAVANDATATWWNPAGLAAGPFVDVSLARAVTETRGHADARRDTATWFALGTPPFGFSYYRLRLTNIQPAVDSDPALPSPTVTESGSREHTRVGVPLHSVAASQYGFTLVQTLVPGVHVGATVKYIRGTVREGLAEGDLPVGELLDAGDALEGGEADAAFGIDAGLIGTAGALRAGLLVRNAVESELENAAGVARFDRQVRAGLAYDAEAIGGPPLTVALDADLTVAETPLGERRNLAVGAEQWLWRERLGIRGGARFNTAGANERAATAGLSLAVRAGLFVDAHVVGGGREDDRGWGVAARVSF
jgi:hypothetical protein